MIYGIGTSSPLIWRSDTMQTLALYLAIGVHPLLLVYRYISMITTKPIVVIWRLFQEVFCTFIFLTNTKLLHVDIYCYSSVQ